MRMRPGILAYRALNAFHPSRPGASKSRLRWLRAPDLNLRLRAIAQDSSMYMKLDARILRIWQILAYSQRCIGLRALGRPRRRCCKRGEHKNA